jgi:hypothetical protein
MDNVKITKLPEVKLRVTHFQNAFSNHNALDLIQ